MVVKGRSGFECAGGTGGSGGGRVGGRLTGHPHSKSVAGVLVMVLAWTPFTIITVLPKMRIGYNQDLRYRHKQTTHTKWPPSQTKQADTKFREASADVMECLTPKSTLQYIHAAASKTAQTD